MTDEQFDNLVEDFCLVSRIAQKYGHDRMLIANSLREAADRVEMGEIE